MLIVGAVALLALMGTLTWWFLRSPQAPAPSTGPVAANPPAAPAPPKTEQPPAPPPQEPATVAQVQPVPPTPATPPEAKPPPRTSTRTDKAEALPPEVRAALEEAERALAAGDMALAIRIAQRSQQVQNTEAARLLMGRAYCHQKDLSNARAQWRTLSSQGKNQLRKYCTKYDIPL
jgi:type IV secretory pathway VirB10-like protein